MADVRRAIRDGLSMAIPDARARVTRDPSCGKPGGWVVPADAPRVLVAFSGGPDSLGLAAALAFEAAKCGVRAGAVIVDHGLQPGSAEVAARAAEQARALGLDPIFVERVTVISSATGPEADARAARYSALTQVAARTGAVAVLLGHTLDDQAETVLLGLARGSGARSLAGMRPVTERDGILLVRPLLGVRRETVAQSCSDQQLAPWIDPHNSDTGYARVRARNIALPVLERELGPGVAEALARTASQLSDDADVLNSLAAKALAEAQTEAGHLTVDTLVAHPPAIRRRVIQSWLQESGLSDLTATHIEAVDDLVTNWSGQAGADVPGARVTRNDGELVAAR